MRDHLVSTGFYTNLKMEVYKERPICVACPRDYPPTFTVWASPDFVAFNVGKEFTHRKQRVCRCLFLLSFDETPLDSLEEHMLVG